MRLEGQKVMGFFAAPPDAVACMAAHLRPPESGQFTILDPCAGEGAAIGQLADLLHCPPENVHAIELDESRTDAVRTNLPQARVLAPAAFEGCAASYASFSFIWLNPPFDSSYDEGRVEDVFLRQATEWMLPHGVLALVCPENVATDNYDTQRKLITWYHNIRVIPFPDHVRKYNEVCVLAVKNETPRNSTYSYNLWESLQAPDDFVYNIPAGKVPHRFAKIQPTKAELHRAILTSPLRRRWQQNPTPRLPSPPLAVNIGHVALLLAAGYLDGVVNPPDGLAHVVRGTSRKTKYIADQTVTENDDGDTTTKTVVSERIELIIRAVDPDGTIHEFSNTEDTTPKAKKS